MPISAGVREQKKRDKEERIRAAALELWRERGFAATTTEEVARRAGIGTGTLFLYVKTKEELLDFVFAGEVGAVADEALASLPPRADVVGKLLHVFTALLGWYARDVELSRRLVAGALLPSGPSRAAPLTIDFINRLAAIVADAQQAKKLPPRGYPVELAYHAFTLYVGGVLTVVNEYGDVDAAAATLRRGLELLFGTPPRPKRRHKLIVPHRT